jgi:LAO/AO transport system kinase
VADLLDRAVGGHRPSLARLLSMVERGGDEARAVSAVVHPRSGRAATVGITGAPGAGKSTLTSALCRSLRGDDAEVAVLAVDPSSPFTGGAILGDRIRMGEHVLDEGVFIRSMATRGHLGGLAVAVPDAARVLDTAGYGWVVVETVGVGQVEVDVASATDTTVVVVNPGWGDAVQAAKAGLVEIADVFVVNKADRAGAADAVRDLTAVLSLRGAADWVPPVVETVATTGRGVDRLREVLVEHRAHLLASGELGRRRARRAEEELRAVVAARLAERAEVLCRGDAWDAQLLAVADGSVDPWSAADAVLRAAGPSGRPA